METVTIVIHLIIVLVLILVILLQRSEGGALGIGGGSGNFMAGRGTANLLTRVTAGLAVAFFLTSLLLALMARWQDQGVALLAIPGDGEAGRELSAQQLLEGLKPDDAKDVAAPDLPDSDDTTPLQVPRVPTAQ